MLAGIVQEGKNLWAYDRVQSEEAAKKHNIIGMYVRIDIIDTVIGMILIENIIRIVFLVEEGKGQW